MENKNTIIFIGPMGGGGIPTNGASVKNYYIVKKLRECAVDLILVDTERWKKEPLVLLKLLYVIIFNPKAKYILSLNSMSAYRVLSFFNFLPTKRCVYYWTIGGSVANWILDGKVSAKVYKVVYKFLVEGTSMVESLRKCGFNNAICVPNFKNIEFIPQKQNRNKKVRFLFLSRINPLKGCDYIINCAKKLNIQFSSDFEIDFYGEIASNYSDFITKIDALPNVNYKGFIDLRKSENYNLLAQYDVMLFPTYWPGEGFPGILIDAFIAGLPVIASDWHLNRDIISNGKTGFLVRANDEEDLYRMMSKCIENPAIARSMSENCQREAKKYDTNAVVTYRLFKDINLFN